MQQLGMLVILGTEPHYSTPWVVNVNMRDGIVPSPACILTKQHGAWVENSS